MDISPSKVLERNANGIARIIEGELIPIANDMKDCLGDMDYSRIVKTPAVPPLERANTLVQNVITRVEVEPNMFHTFTDVLKKHGKLSSVRRLVDPNGLIVAGDQSLVPLKKVLVKANMIGYLVGLQSTLKYSNDSKEPLEVLFKFPVEESFAVVGLEAVIGGRKIKAHIREKQEAKHTYDDAKARGFTVALAEEKTGDIFSISLGNLPPKSEADIHLKLAGELPIDAEGAVRFTLPAVLKQRYTPTGSTDPLTQISGLPGQVVRGTAPAVYDFALTVAKAETISDITSPTHNITTQDKSGVIHVSLQNAAPLDKDLVILVKFNDPHQPKIIPEPGDCRLSQSTYMKCPAVMLNYFPKFEAKQSACEFIFLIDRSGSMRGSAIASACDSLILFLKSIPSGCTFNIIGFGSSFTPMFPNSVLYDQQHLDTAIKHAENIQADLGGTELLPPLEYIFKQPLLPGFLRQIFLLTDGAVNNTEQCVREVQNNAKNTRVFTFGIGSGVSTELIKGIARAGNGTAEFVYEGERMQPKVICSLKRALQPTVTDISINFDVPSSFKVIQAPRELPAMFNEDKLIVYGIVVSDQKAVSDQLLKTSVNGTATLAGKILDNPIEFKVTFEIPPSSHFQSSFEMPTVHHLASKSLIHEWQNRKGWIATASYEERKREIVNLSIESGVVSSHTAYIALDEEQDKLIEGAMKTWDVVATMAQYRESIPHPVKPSTPSNRSPVLNSGEMTHGREGSMARQRDDSPQPLGRLGSTSTGGVSNSAKLSYGQLGSMARQRDDSPQPLGSMSNDEKGSIPMGNSNNQSRQSADYTMFSPVLQTHGSVTCDEEGSMSMGRQRNALQFLIRCQTAEGFWTCYAFCHCEEHCADMFCYCEFRNMQHVCATLCVLTYIKITFPSLYDEWKLVATKAEEWLECQILPDQVSLEELKKEAKDIITRNHSSSKAHFWGPHHCRPHCLTTYPHSHCCIAHHCRELRRRSGYIYIPLNCLNEMCHYLRKKSKN